MSTLRVNTLQDTAGVERYLARAWVNFNGTGTVAIRAAGNVSSITDNGTGDYTVNFTTAMPDANYAVVTSNQFTGAQAANPMMNITSLLASSARLTCQVKVNSTYYEDPGIVTVAIFR